MAKRDLWSRFIVHLAGVLPLAWIIFDGLTGRLSVNPIQDMEQRMGRAALYFLAATLAVTPIYILSGWKGLYNHRRALGLYAFLYAALHFATFAGLDYGFDFKEVGRQVIEKPFIALGIISGSILLLLAVTSFPFFKSRAERTRLWLQRSIYAAAVLVIIHYALARKGNLLHLSGDILKPALWGALVLFLLFIRIPPVRKWVIGIRERLFSSKDSV
jgi:methionine sulfoxide reductase heme-binding subunit